MQFEEGEPNEIFTSFKDGTFVELEDNDTEKHLFKETPLEESCINDLVDGNPSKLELMDSMFTRVTDSGSILSHLTNLPPLLLTLPFHFSINCPPIVLQSLDFSYKHEPYFCKPSCMG